MENTKLRASQKYKKRSTFDSIWRQLRKNKGAIVGMILLVVIIIIALASPYIFNYETDVIANNVKERMQHPSSEHWFGTDDLGREVTVASHNRVVAGMGSFALLSGGRSRGRCGRARRGRHARRGSGLCRRRV